MRIVIDTNILISAILRDRTPEKVVLFVIEASCSVNQFYERFVQDY